MSETSPIQTPPTPGTGRWSWRFRISLVLCLMVTGWCAWSLFGLSRRDQTIRKFEDSGARIRYEDQIPDAPTFWRRGLFSIPGGISVAQPWLVDAQMTEFGDQDIPLINEVPGLKRLWLRNSQVTDDGLRELPRLGQLESFSAPSVATEQGLVCLTRFPRLKSLQLTEVRVTPAIVDWMVALKSLEELDLRGTSTDAEQIQRLLDAHPQLKIER